MIRHSMPSNTRTGFTLTEILVASALMGFLAVMTWSLFDTYRNLFESGINRSGRVRIARALAEQFTDDIHSAIQESTVKQTVSLETSGEEPSSTRNPSQATGLTSGQATSLAEEPATALTEEPTTTSTESGTTENSSTDVTMTRRFGLFGSSHTLRLDVLQVDPRYVYRIASRTSLSDSDNVGSLLFDDSLDDEASSPVGKAAELRTIEYTFTPKEEDEINAQAPEEDPLAETSLDESKELQQPRRPGLMRRELSFDVMFNEEDGSLMDDIGLEEVDPDESLNPDECYLPEVSDLSFRYYDGNGWTTSWDSLARKSLPVAVEIIFTLDTEPPKSRRAGEEAGTLEESSTDVPDDATVGADVETGEVAYIDEEYESYQDAMNPPKDQYRVLVTLPTSAKHPGVRAESDTTFETMPEPLTPGTLQTPSLQTPKLKTKEKPKPDERWMRE